MVLIRSSFYSPTLLLLGDGFAAVCDIDDRNMFWYTYGEDKVSTINKIIERRTKSNG